MAPKKTFAATLAPSPLVVPPPVKPQSPWEAYFMAEIKRMQQEVAHLRSELSTKEARIINLETELQTIKVKQEVQESALKQCTPETEPATTQPEDVPPQIKSETFTNEVLAIMKENERVKSLEEYIRIGGLPVDWAKGTDPNEQIEGWAIDVDILKEMLTKVVPFVDLGEPTDIIVKGTQAKVRYYYKDDKIKVMRQTKSLQGTSVWISDDLKPIQLKNRAKELAKVREARKEGKWAVYRGGKAIIRDFKNPPPPSKTWT